MSQRMTNELIAQIVANALRATNLDAEREQITADTKMRVRELLLAKVPEKFLKLTLANPREWFQWQDQVYVQSGDNNPIDIMSRKFGEDSRHRGAYLPVEPNIPVPAHSTVKLKAPEDLSDLIERANAWATKKYQAECELRQFLRSCTTVKQAIQRMPEIEKHIPPAAVKTTHPIVAATGALTALTALGFDTTTKA